MTIEFECHMQNYKELSVYHRTGVSLKDDNCCCHYDLWKTNGLQAIATGA